MALTDEEEAILVAQALWDNGYRQVSRSARIVARAHIPADRMNTWVVRQYYRRMSKDCIEHLPEAVMRHIRSLGGE